MTWRALTVLVLLLSCSVAQAQGLCQQGAFRSSSCHPISDSKTTQGRSIAGDRHLDNAIKLAQNPAPFATSGPASNNRALPPPSLDDEFNSLSLHYRPIGRDIWGLIAPRTPQGRGGPNWFEGHTRMWWTNPFNPKTPVQGLYTVSNGQLHLGLIPTPSAYQSWIDRSAGIHMPFVGALLYSVQKQLYGYFEIRASVDSVPGLTFQACLETGDVAFPFEIDIILYTNRDGSQHVKFDIATHKGVPSTEVDGIDITQMHIYGIEWTGSKITWYIDGTKRWSQPSPGGNYDTYPALWYLLTGAAYSGSDTDPNPVQLPAHAHIDWVRNWPGTEGTSSRQQH